MSKQKLNMLDFIPGKNPGLPFSERGTGLVTVTIRHKGLYDRIAQVFFRTPAESRIDLDQYGSFVWNQIDGIRTVYDIGKLVEREFGEDAHPLYPRLAKFFCILKNNRFIEWRKPHSIS